MGAAWNPSSRQGKAEIAFADDVSGYITGWEQDRVGDTTHPLTNRVFGDFLFRCTSKSSFHHYTTFFSLGDSDQDPTSQIEKLASEVAHPVSITINGEKLVTSPHVRSSPASVVPGIILDSPKQVYVGEEFNVDVKLTGRLAASTATFAIDGKAIPIRKRIALDAEGKHTVTAEVSDGSKSEFANREILVKARPPLPYNDLTSLLARPDQRTLHGNLVRYWGGQPDIYWKEYEPETLGFTHAWFFNGGNWGSYSNRDWEFWRKEKTAYGTFVDHSRDTTVVHPSAKRTHWEPDRLELEYEFDGVDLSETKFLEDDILADRIRIKNSRKSGDRITLSFKGTGHAMSEGYYDSERGAVVVKEHAYSYTGLNRVFVASQPFSSWSFESKEKSTDVQASPDLTYGDPVEYTFAFDIELQPGETKYLTLALALDKDLEAGYSKARHVTLFPDSALSAARWEWNDWLNYEIPRFRSSDQALDQLYYYLWFVIRCNFIDAHNGWYRHGYSAPTASTYFMTMFGWDSAFNAIIGKWLAHPEIYSYGNLQNWTLAQAPCGFLPEFFGQDWRCTWGHRIPLMADALYQVYRKNGDIDFVRAIYPMLKKSEQWEACEIDDSPYWSDYYRNMPDFRQRQKSFRNGTPWVSNELAYYEEMALFARLCDDESYAKLLDNKALLSRQRLLDDPACRSESLGSSVKPGSFGHILYWAHSLVSRDRVDEIAASFHSPDLFPSILHIAAATLDTDVSGDGWDHGTSVTVNYFLNAGLFLTGRPEECFLASVCSNSCQFRRYE